MIEQKPLEIIIIGLGASGLYASKSALGYNRNCHVTILEKRDFDQFSPCGLPFVIEGVVKDFEMLKHDVPEIKNKLTKLLKHEVTAVDTGKKNGDGRGSGQLGRKSLQLRQPHPGHGRHTGQPADPRC